MPAAIYVNPRNGTEWATDRPLWRAPDDGGYLNLTPGPGLCPREIDTGERSLWRYRAAIRLAEPPAVSLGEGWTPLVPSVWDGVPVHMKMDFLMPSGSFKDRGTAVMLNYLTQVGVTTILEDSSGNAGASIATYAAALAMACRIMVPASAPMAKKVQIAAAGATVEAIAGSREDVSTAALKAAETMFYASHNWQPFFLEGTKTLAFELWEQLGFKAPDCVVIPLGQGSNVLGCRIGFGELMARGRIARLPRLYAVQARNCAPCHAAFQAGAQGPVPIEVLATMADGIASEKPVRLPDVLRAIRECGGGTVAVGEAEIVMALGRLARAGFFVEPTAAAGVAGLGHLIAGGDIRAGETTVVILTGSGLKAVERIGRELGLVSG